MGTRTVPNGDPLGPRDVEWGVMLKIAAWGVGLVGAIFATIFAAGVLRIFAMSADAEVVKARQVLVLERLTRIEVAISSEDYVSRQEFTQWLQSSERRTAVSNLAFSSNEAGKSVKAEVESVIPPKEKP